MPCCQTPSRSCSIVGWKCRLARSSSSRLPSPTPSMRSDSSNSAPWTSATRTIGKPCPSPGPWKWTPTTRSASASAIPSLPRARPASIPSPSPPTSTLAVSGFASQASRARPRPRQVDRSTPARPRRRASRGRAVRVAPRTASRGAAPRPHPPQQRLAPPGAHAGERNNAWNYQLASRCVCLPPWSGAHTVPHTADGSFTAALHRGPQSSAPALTPQELDERKESAPTLRVPLLLRPKDRIGHLPRMK